MFNLLGITFHWYGLILGVATMVAMEIALKHRGEIDKNKLESSMWWVILGGVLGARVYHVIDLWSEYYVYNWTKIFYIWEGGLGIWGAIAGGVLALLIYCHFNKLNFTEYLDKLVIGLPLAQTIGRLGNWVNGELHGKNGEPLFAYEGILNLILFGVLIQISKKRQHHGFLTGIYLIGYGVIRVLLENLRPDQSIWRVAGVPTAIWFCFAAILSGLTLIFWRRRF